MLSIVHNDTMELGNVLSCSVIVYYQSLSDNTKTRFAVSIVQILYENIPLTEMLFSLKVEMKYIHIYCFRGKHFMCWDLRGMLETDNFG